ncbi:hypothetical protein CASFOL_014371 [Castilleja foliolosa]|uniref:OB domain-containing protein n=1 Tax=Castilleja foliolosa TaxID=1961234 RepID=A0ABD3DRS5_9LAMI
MSSDSAPPALDGLTLIDASVHELEFSQRVQIKSILGRPDKGAGLAGQKVRIGGWVKTGREADKGSFAFLEVNDGSCPGNLQVLVKANVCKLSDVVSTGASVHVEGLLMAWSKASSSMLRRLLMSALWMRPSIRCLRRN